MPQRELSTLHLAAAHLQTLQALLAQYVPSAEVWAYGSRVTGGAHEGSDLDLVLRNPTNLTEDVEGWSDLNEALRESSFPILVELHLWPRLPVSFQWNIEQCYVVLRRGGGTGLADTREAGIAGV